MKKKTWFRLDNAAKVYPPTSGSRRGGMFALSAILYEQVDKDILNDAVNVVLNRFPTFKVKLNRGIFWYYLEENKNPFYVTEEPGYFLKHIDEKQSNNYLFRVFYFENKITLSIFHALTDGTGGLELLKAIVFEYLILKGYNIKAEGALKTIYSPSTKEESIDKFLQVFDNKISKPQKEYPAFKINGTPFSKEGMGIISGRVKIEQIKALSKKYNVTITTFVSALVAYLVYENFIKGQKVKNKMVKVLVPVNMRKIYPTDTVRNFALFTRPGHDFSTEITLEECIKSFDEQLKECLKKENLDKILYSNVKTEKNILLKITPLFLKDLAIKIAYTKVGDVLHTTTVSNLGIVELPTGVKKYVKDFIFAIGTSFTAKSALCLSSYQDNLNITFTREYVENNLEKAFFQYLTNNGVEVELQSNYWEDAEWNIVINAKLQ